MTRNGKIARLRAAVRDELNQRMEKGEEGASLLAWLNGLEEVQQILKRAFEGAPITKQNLSEWRQGGWREWQVRQEWLGEACEFAQFSFEAALVLEMGTLPGKVAGALAARYAALLNTWDGEPDEKFEARLRLLRWLLRDV